MKYLLLLLSVTALFDYNGRCYKLKELNNVCSEHKECETNYCLKKKCSNLPKEGEGCGSQFRCAEGLGCGDSLKCVKLPVKGQECVMTHVQPNACKSGFLCYNGVCDHPKRRGDDCSDNKECGHELSCVQNKSSNARKCDKMPGKCKTHSDCRGGMYCDKFNQCKYQQKKSGKCTEQINCRKGLDCVTNFNPFTAFYKPYKCGRIPKAGRTCMNECEPGHYCGKRGNNMN
jgi:hypothetical protein